MKKKKQFDTVYIYFVKSSRESFSGKLLQIAIAFI